MENFLSDINFLEEPLVGINQKLHNHEEKSKLSDEELRSWIQHVRTLRESAQTRKAAMSLGKKELSKKQEEAKASKFEEFEV